MTLGDKTPESLRIVPQQRRGTATVQRILNAALVVLRRAPNPSRDGISMEEIAREAHTSVPAVYRYFAGADEVFASLVQQEQARILQQGMELLESREIGSAAELAGTLADFFIAVYSDLMRAPKVLLFLLRQHHEVSYAAFGAVCDPIRGVMRRTGKHSEQVLSDVQIVTALSGLASAVKAVILRDPGHLTEPEFRARMVQMMLGVLAGPALAHPPGEPVEWTYDRRDGPLG